MNYIELERRNDRWIKDKWLKIDKDAIKESEKNFEKTWEHFDQANEGKLSVEVMSPFFRYLMGNNQISLE
mgnify:CR=1 FL=1